MRYRDKSVLVTGAARGIGRAAALALAKEGARLELWDIDGEEAQRTAREIREAGGDAQVQRVDVSRFDDVASAVGEVKARRRGLNVLFHCAGIMSSAFIDDCDLDEWQRVLTVNLTGSFHVCKAVIPLMRETVGGRIVLISSAAAKSSTTICGIGYVASKAGVLGLVKQLAYRLAADRITVNAVAPGLVDTDMPHSHFPEALLDRSMRSVPLQRMASSNEIAQAMLYLASDDAAYITGEVLDVNGGSLID